MSENSPNYIKWLEESVLSYAQRKKLSKKVFCGPERSYPANDKRHAQNCLARASQMLKKGKLSKAQHGRISACCRRALKKFGGTPSETVEDTKLLEWFKRERGV